MIDSIMAILSPILAFLSEKYGVVGLVLGYLVLIVAPLVSILIEVLEAVVALTPSTKDDDFAAKVKAAWAKYGLPVLELLPHANIPLAPLAIKILDYAKRGAAALLAGIKAFLGK